VIIGGGYIIRENAGFEELKWRPGEIARVAGIENWEFPKVPIG
jgi:hypothetical protein